MKKVECRIENEGIFSFVGDRYICPLRGKIALPRFAGFAKKEKFSNHTAVPPKCYHKGGVQCSDIYILGRLGHRRLGQ